MDQNVIEQIIRRIMSDPALTALLANGTAEQDSARGRALILVNNSPDVEQRLQYLADSWKQVCFLDAVMSPGAQAAGIKLPVGMNLVDENMAWSDLSKWNRVVLPAISQNTLAKLATGIRDGALVELAAKAIEAGMKIDAVVGYVIPTTAPVAWRTMYDNYLQQLRSFNVCVHEVIQSVVNCPGCSDHGSCGRETDTQQVKLAPTAAQQVQALVEQALPVVTSPAAVQPVLKNTMSQQLYQCTAQVLTERDVMGFARNSVVKLAPRTILTPLAKERLGERQIDYFREGE